MLCQSLARSLGGPPKKCLKPRAGYGILDTGHRRVTVAAYTSRFIVGPTSSGWPCSVWGRDWENCCRGDVFEVLGATMEVV